MLAASDEAAEEPPVLVVAADAEAGSDTPADAAPADAGAVDEPPSQEVEVASPPLPPLVIFDTDMGPDIDDALALAMLHGYQTQGTIELAAVTLSRNSPTGAAFADAINTFYGRPDVPIGIQRSSPAVFDDRASYVSLAATWPNDVGDQSLAEGVAVQRQVLAEAEAADRSVIIVQTGFSGNLAQLVDSGPDAASPKTGIELIRDTVSVLSIMAGSTELGIVEFNIEHDIGAARNLLASWPVPLVLSPFELGNALHYPYASIQRDFGWAERHPVVEAYEFQDLGWHEDAPPFYDMRSWDLTSVLQAVEPDGGYFSMSDPGTVVVDEAGRTTFTPGAGRHVVLDDGARMPPDRRQRAIDRMIELVAARP